MESKKPFWKRFLIRLLAFVLGKLMDPREGGSSDAMRPEPAGPDPVPPLRSVVHACADAQQPHYHLECGHIQHGHAEKGSEMPCQECAHEPDVAKMAEVIRQQVAEQMGIDPGDLEVAAFRDDRLVGGVPPRLAELLERMGHSIMDPSAQQHQYIIEHVYGSMSTPDEYHETFGKVMDMPEEEREMILDSLAGMIGFEEDYEHSDQEVLAVMRRFLHEFRPPDLDLGF